MVQSHILRLVEEHGGLNAALVFSNLCQRPVSSAPDLSRNSYIDEPECKVILSRLLAVELIQTRVFGPSSSGGKKSYTFKGDGQTYGYCFILPVTAQSWARKMELALKNTLLRLAVDGANEQETHRLHTQADVVYNDLILFKKYLSLHVAQTTFA